MTLRRSCLFAVCLILFLQPALAANDTSPGTAQETSPWYWYNKAVDLANEGKFAEALTANEQALALNRSMPVAWANEAGILVQLHRYNEAIEAADNALSENRTDMPNTYAAAYYSKADALRALGRTAEARDLYAKAYALDNTLVPPDLSTGTSAAAATSPRSPLTPATSIIALIAAVLGAVYIAGRRR